MTDFETWWQSKDGWRELDGARAIAMRAYQAGRESDTALLRQALEALEYHMAQTRPIYETTTAITALRERLGVKA